jgi:phosphate transport system substrate-binding protein
MRATPQEAAIAGAVAFVALAGTFSRAWVGRVACPSVPATAKAAARRWAGFSFAAVIGFGLLAWWVVRSDDGPVPPFLGGPHLDGTAAEPEARRDSALVHVAGSGSNIPITRALAAAFPGAPDRRPVVHPSIGSGGGLRALLDGAIDLALVSRTLAPTERELGLVETPYARVPVIFAVNASVPDTGLSSADLLAIFRRERTTWSDGSPIIVLQREPGDSSHRAVARHLPGFEAANDVAYERESFRVLYLDDDMRDALAATPGAVGLFGQGAVPSELPIRGLSVDGVSPTVDNVAEGRYPLFKDLSFVSAGPPRGPAAEFVDFSHSPAGDAIISANGAIPIGGDDVGAQ